MFDAVGAQLAGDAGGVFRPGIGTDLNEKRAVAAFRELRARKKSPPIGTAELIQRLREGGLVQTSLWLSTSDAAELL